MGTISASHAEGDVDGEGNRVGGLVGENEGTITASYAAGTVSSSGIEVGGLVGANFEVISAAYATGAASGSSGVGGLVGANFSAIRASYATGAASGTSNVGGLIGSNRGTISANYWDTQTSSLSASAGGVGKTTSELQSPTDYSGIYADWNVDLDGDGADDDPWGFGTSSQYPALKGLGISVAEQRQSHPAAVSSLGAPTIGTVTPGAGSLAVSWTAPSSDGGSAITAYDLRHIQTSADETVDSNWTVVDDVWTTGGGTLQYTLTGLTGGTQYDLQMRAVNAVGDGPWSATATGTPTTAVDRDILVALYNATDGANWTNNTNWLSDEPLGDWHGVTTDANGRVTGLRLSSNQLSGRLPTELGSLSSLTRLLLWGNQLTGAIPAELGGLSILKDLSLAENQLTGTIPAELGSLSNLTNLVLWGNQLTGAIPAELDGLSNLESMTLYNNQLTGAIPVELGSLSGLTYLYLGGNQLTGAIPAELGNLSRLEVLLLHDNQLTGGIPAELGSLSSLTGLYLHDNQLTGALPQNFTNLTALGEFRFRTNAGLCAPTDAAFQAWLQSIAIRNGPNCSSPGAPTIGTVTPGAESLAVSWTAPSSDGGSAITAYDLRHIETSADETDDSNWTVVDDVWATGGGTLQHTLTGLTGGTQYDLQMRAVNAGGDGPWSATTTGTPAVTTGSTVGDTNNDGTISRAEIITAFQIYVQRGEYSRADIIGIFQRYVRDSTN